MGLRTILLFIIALTLTAHANVVGPKVYEQKDMGDISLNQFIYSLSADCTAATVSVTVMNETAKPLRGVHTYLNYVEFSSQLMATAETDQDGVALLKLPGNVKLMHGLFTLVLEKYGYKNKEIHFDLSPCFAAAPKQNTTQPAKNSTQTQNQTQTPAQNTTTKPPAQNNNTGAQGNPQKNSSTGSGNATQNTSKTTPGSVASGFKMPSQICPAAAFIAAVSCMALAFSRSRKKWRKYSKPAR
jgi:hypothetical protein